MHKVSGRPWTGQLYHEGKIDGERKRENFDAH